MLKPFPVVTLLTDFGLQDGYVGVMKGVILRINPSAKIIDLCERIAHQDVFGTAYVLFSAYKYFPEQTVHVAVVDPGVGSNRKIVCLKTKEHIFLAPDNGILSFIVAHEKPEIIVEVTNKEYFLPEVSNTFHGRDIFAPVAGHILNGVNVENFGKKISKIKEITLPSPILSSNGILTAEIIYIDGFGNLITNIDCNVLKKVEFDVNSTNVGFSIVVGNNEIAGISKSYADVNDGDLLAIFGSSGYLEIAVNKGNAKELLNLKKGSKVIILPN